MAVNPKWFNTEVFKALSKSELRKQYGNHPLIRYEDAEAYWNELNPAKEKVKKKQNPKRISDKGGERPLFLNSTFFL